MSFDVAPRTRVGIVGRTGAGKSSLTTALFRLVEPSPGSEVTIDGMDVLSMGLEDLRSRLAIVPQVWWLTLWLEGRFIFPWAGVERLVTEESRTGCFQSKDWNYGCRRMTKNSIGFRVTGECRGGGGLQERNEWNSVGFAVVPAGVCLGVTSKSVCYVRGESAS